MCIEKLVLEVIDFLLEGAVIGQKDSVVCEELVTLLTEGGELGLKNNEALFANVEDLPKLDTERAAEDFERADLGGAFVGVVGVDDVVNRIDGDTAFLRPSFFSESTFLADFVKSISVHVRV
jgi:hypothetical protein